VSGKKGFPKRYVITAAQAFGGDDKGVPNYKFLASLEKFCKDKKAELIILKMAGSTAKQVDLHPDLADRSEIFFGERDLNRKISISNMVVPPQNVDCSTGRVRFIQQGRTAIIAHPKQRFKAVSNSNEKLPKVLLGTGACTTPNYRETNHRGDAAKRDHMYGAWVIEIVDDVTYHIRPIRSGVNGVFVDLGKRFDGRKKQRNTICEALVLGDLHWGDTDPVVMIANFAMIRKFKPNRLVIHDLFNGHSISHHKSQKMIERVRDFKKGRSNLRKELTECREVLIQLSRAVGRNSQVIIVASNHNEFLNRYLEEKRWVNDTENYEIASELSTAMINGEDPVKAGVELIGPIPPNIKFLDREDDEKSRGVQLGSHGDKGMNGARGSMRSRELAHGKSITGHSHTPEILRNTFIVGTSTHLRLSYTKGSASSWMHTNAVLYENGSVQLLNIINGQWTID
jgi:hypothetical protein